MDILALSNDHRRQFMDTYQRSGIVAGISFIAATAAGFPGQLCVGSFGGDPKKATSSFMTE
jgi:hypothetical protein